MSKAVGLNVEEMSLNLILHKAKINAEARRLQKRTNEENILKQSCRNIFR